MSQWNVIAEYNEKEPILDQLLSSKGFVSSQEKELFLKPPPFSYWFQRLPKSLLRSLRETRELITKSIKEERVIVIHGDYDADGVCATAILYKTLKNELNYEHVYAFIPNRFDHGYGFSKKSIDAIIETLPMEKLEKGAVFITVDCGITSVDEVRYLKEQGHIVIITDHHQKPEELPPADCLVWYDQVVGTTVAYLLARVLGSKDRDFIAFCCLATITDLQPILEFNRTLVRDGLDIINERPPLGIKSLLEVAGKAKLEITAYDLGWMVGPRLNATGRVEDASNALDLLLEQDSEKSKEMAWELNRVNMQRQDKTIEMFELAEDIDEEDLPNIIISHHENYHEGIIGLVASRLAQKYHRPSVVISTAKDVSKGSVRSIKGINIIEILRGMDDGLFLSLGGHPMAAGFSINKGDIGVLKDRLESFTQDSFDEEMLTKTTDMDMAIPANIINEKFVERLDMLRPFGMGNRQPVFGSYGLKVSGVNVVGREQRHLSIRFYNDKGFLKGIFFNYKDYFEGEIKMGDQVDAAYILKKNEFNGRIYVDLILKDIKKA